MTRKYFLLFVFSFIFVSASSAEQPGKQPGKYDKCGTSQYMDFLESKNTSLKSQMQQDENLIQQLQSIASVSRTSQTVYTIPVVVHVVYFTGAQNISDAQVLSQIDVLNEDFGRTNADAANTPSAFLGVAGPTDFQFCMAIKDPNGNPTNGIERRQTTVSSFQPNDDVKSFANGGLDAWNVNRYFNIWVCNLGGFVLGYGEMPASLHTNTYGVVVQYDAFGRTGNVTAPYNKGRTCTHEISHCFRLSHIWGDDNGACGPPGDYVSDTPDQADATFGCYTFPHTDNCSPNSPGIMYMNFMDYSDDNCLNMFTAGQAARMFTAIDAFYPSLLVSTACMVDGIDSPESFELSIYPNPSEGIFVLDMYTTPFIGSSVNIRITNVLGKVVHESDIQNPNGFVHSLDLTKEESGIYFITIYNDKYKRTERITLTR